MHRLTSGSPGSLPSWSEILHACPNEVAEKPDRVGQGSELSRGIAEMKPEFASASTLTAARIPVMPWMQMGVL